VESKTQAELSWFTANVLENKFVPVGVGTLLLLASTVVTTASGLIADGTSLSTILCDFVLELWQHTKLVNVSFTLDLAILTPSAVTLIPNDYQWRVDDDS
jgi:hypothetical protein